MKIYDLKGKPISLGTVVGRGGEAVVYRVIDHPAWLAKIYEPAPRPNYAAKLAWMLEHPPANPTHALNHPSLAWPNGLLYGQGKHLAGYLMPYIQEAVPILVVFNPRRRVETLAQFDRRYLHRAARNLASAAGALHASGYVVGDLNESNVLVTSSALVTLIDTDSFQVQERRRGQVVTYACPVAKPEYTPPELQGKSLANTVRSPEQDAFSLGVLIFQLLMEGNHPFRAQWLGKGDPPPIEERIGMGGFPYTSTPGLPVRPPKYAPDLDLLHPEISELIRRCFIDGHRDPSLRPKDSAWEWAIAEAEDSLVQCPNRHIFSAHLRACPVCHAAPHLSASQTRTSRRPDPRTAARPANAAFTGSPPPGARAGTTSMHGYAQSRTGSANAANKASNPKHSPGNSTSSGIPSIGGAASRFRQAQQAWEIFKYWQAQQAQVQQAGTGSGVWGSRQVQQANSALKTWKFWQAQRASQAPPQAAQPAKPTSSRPATNAQPAQGSPGAGSAQHAQQPGAPHAAHSGAAQNTQAQSGQSQPSQSSPHPQPSRPAPPHPGAQPGRPANSRPAAASAQPANSLLNWAGPRLYKSLAIGGGLGALVGALPGALIGVAGWSTGNMASWVWLWALGGASAGLLRGWQPGYRMSLRIDQAVGWQRVWPAFGVLAGAALGGFIGVAIGWWAVFPVFLGLLGGAWLGRNAGRKLWQAGTRFGWERIWAGVIALSAALLGWRLAAWLGAGSLSIQLANSFSAWITGQSASLVLVALGVGALGGALGGAVAGTLADLFARLLNLLD